jgi:hypothetical protein
VFRIVDGNVRCRLYERALGSKVCFERASATRVLEGGKFDQLEHQQGGAAEVAAGCPDGDEAVEAGRGARDGPAEEAGADWGGGRGHLGQCTVRWLKLQGFCLDHLRHP